ncbi:MAG: hypothetical protein ABW137_01445 [Mycobacterium sp.]
MAVPAYALALTLAVTAPLLAPGYLLLRDAVSTPRSYLTDAALGVSEAAPRALPQDFAVAVASHVVDGGVVVKVLLVAGLWLAGWGAGQLAAFVVPAAGLPGRFVAVTLAVWNPYVAERLLQGHWSLLVGYGCLPWVALSVLRLRDGDGSWWPLAFWVAVAGLTPTGLMLATAVALASCAAPGSGRARWACAAGTLGIAVAAALPWLVASAVSESLSVAGDAGVPEFAARAEPGLGTLLSLTGLGGIWNAAAVPATRTTPFAVVGTVVLLGIVILGVRSAWLRPQARPLLLLAVAAVVGPALMATGPGLATVEAAARTLPGLGVLRDGQKWVALAMPGYVVAAAAAVTALAPRVPRIAAAAVGCVALLAVLPDLAWGVGGKVESVRYPPGWSTAAALINADPRTVAVLPQMSMRNFAWAGYAPILDPLPRWVAADVWATGDLVIGGKTIPGEGTRARQVEQLVLSGAGVDELARAGVGWVVTEGGAGPRLALPVAFSDDDLTVYRVGGDRPAAAHRGLLIAAHLGWLATLFVGAAGTVVTGLRRRRRPTTTTT